MNAVAVALATTAAAAVLTVPPAAAAKPAPDDDIGRYPLAQGNYTSPSDFYFVFFKTPDGRSCAIGPNGGPVGCDSVPAGAPPGTNQTVVYPWGPAEYRHSDSSFARDVDVLPAGHRLENWGATCAVVDVGTQSDTVRCETYNDHGFTESSASGELW